MANFVIAGDTSGTVTLQAPAVSGTTTLTLPTTSGTVLTSASSVTTSQLPTGSVIQVVQATYGTLATTSSATLTATGLSASITPSSSSNKILVCMNMQGCTKNNQNAGNAVWLSIYKNGSSLFSVCDLINYNGTTSVANSSVSSQYLDSPATTSSTTYAIYFANSGNVASVAVNNYYGAQAYTNSTLTLMEIKA